MGAIEGNRPVSDNDWETITKGGDDKIRKWIAEQLDGKSCVVVLIGANTAGRKWITYEIVKGWNDGKGVVGIYVHNLQDSDKIRASKGANPFDSIGHNGTGKPLSSVVKAYDPPYLASTDVYAHITRNLSTWVDEAVTIRENA